MIIKSWDGETVLADDTDFVIIDQHGSKWRISDTRRSDTWSLQLLFVANGRMAVASVNGNVMDIGVA